MRPEAEASGESCGIPDLGAGYPELAAEGWTYRWCGEARRVEEQRALYAELGFETRIVPLTLPEDSGVCLGCFEADPGRFRVLFTREAARAGSGDS